MESPVSLRWSHIRVRQLLISHILCGEVIPHTYKGYPTKYALPNETLNVHDCLDMGPAKLVPMNAHKA